MASEPWLLFAARAIAVSDGVGGDNVSCNLGRRPLSFSWYERISGRGFRGSRALVEPCLVASAGRRRKLDEVNRIF